MTAQQLKSSMTILGLEPSQADRLSGGLPSTPPLMIDPNHGRPRRKATVGCEEPIQRRIPFVPGFASRRIGRWRRLA
jgi:hypothetical protein